MQTGRVTAPTVSEPLGTYQYEVAFWTLPTYVLGSVEEPLAGCVGVGHSLLRRECLGRDQEQSRLCKSKHLEQGHTFNVPTPLINK